MYTVFQSNVQTWDLQLFLALRICMHVPRRNLLGSNLPTCSLFTDSIDRGCHYFNKIGETVMTLEA